MPSSGHDTAIAIINSQHLPAPGLYKNGLSAVNHGYRRGSRGLLATDRLWEMGESISSVVDLLRS